MKILIHYIFLLFGMLQVACGLILIWVVNRQESKNEGLTGQIGSPNVSTFKGKAGKEEQMVIVTKYAAVAFLILTLLSAFGYNRF